MTKKIILFGVFASLLAFVSCKPKSSNYKSIYEAAKEAEGRDDSYTIPQTSYDYNQYYDDYSDNMNVNVKQEVIRPVYQTDENRLKKYNVVIAAMGMKTNAIALKERMEKAGYQPIVVQNNQGLYRVIIAGSDTRNGAVQERNSILNRFRQEGNNEVLRKKYGIPFDDWWILERTY